MTGENKELIPKTSDEWFIRFDAKVDLINKNLMRLMYAMLGIIAATLGVRFMGTSPLFIIATYAALVSGIFLLGVVTITWNSSHWTRKAVRIVFAVFLLFSTICRAFIIHDSIIAFTPGWYVPIVDGFFILLSILLMLSSWKDKM